MQLRVEGGGDEGPHSSPMGSPILGHIIKIGVRRNAVTPNRSRRRTWLWHDRGEVLVLLRQHGHLACARRASAICDAWPPPGASSCRTAITDTPTTRPSERLVGAAKVIEGMARPGSTAAAADLFGRRCRKAELDARVLQRWRPRFSPDGDESARRSAPRLTDVGSGREAFAGRPSR
jgi:hypothetical protein